jgi:hypothetical protein
MTGACCCAIRPRNRPGTNASSSPGVGGHGGGIAMAWWTVPQGTAVAERHVTERLSRWLEM